MDTNDNNGHFLCPDLFSVVCNNLFKKPLKSSHRATLLNDITEPKHRFFSAKKDSFCYISSTAILNNINMRVTFVALSSGYLYNYNGQNSGPNVSTLERFHCKNYNQH